MGTGLVMRGSLLFLFAFGLCARTPEWYSANELYQRTEYVQALTGDNPVAEFAKGSFVGAWLSALSADEARDFEVDYRQRIASAYPACCDGVTLFPFRRFFLVAQR